MSFESGAIWAVGTMTGTSLDGVDAALVHTDGRDIIGFGSSSFRPFSSAEQEVLRAGLGCWPGDPPVGAVERLIEAAHQEILAPYVNADLIGFHGQTLAHDPGGMGTHQAGRAGVLAEALGKPVIYDFRSADVALGGEGAPLAPAFHHACARYVGLTEPVAFLNLGGVGNLTLIDPRLAQPEDEGALLAFDTGPANAPLNDLMRTLGGGAYDAGGRLALAGRADMELVQTVLEHGYFRKMPPKSLDRDSFAQVLAPIFTLAPEDAAATFVALIAVSVAQGLSCAKVPVSRVFVCGGGRHNHAIMAALQAQLRAEVLTVEALGLDGDMLEAQAFAYLAVRVARGLPTSFPSTTGVAGNVGGGQRAVPTGLEKSLK